MALHAQKLNGDSTFLLTFAPAFAPTQHARKFPGSFTILVDPCLRGPSTVLRPRFQTTSPVSGCGLTSLADIYPPPDLIIISQDKSDHCHRETLCTLPADSQVPIVATQAAAKKILSWAHFIPGNVHALHPFRGSRSDELAHRIPIAPYSTSSAAGEVTIANIATRLDVTRLHNAIGITYRPPGTALRTRQGSYIDLKSLHAQPRSPRSRLSDQTLNASSRFSKAHRPRSSPLIPDVFSSGRDSHLSMDACEKISLYQALRVDSATPVTMSSTGKPGLDAMSASAQQSEPETEPEQKRPGLPKPFSVIYTPHGTSPRTLRTYVERHLRPNDGLPLDAIFHSVNLERKSCLLGGSISHNGAPAGAELARCLHARHWVGAHDSDEVKSKRMRSWPGLCLRSRRFAKHQVEGLVAVAPQVTHVHLLPSGARVRLAAEETS